MNSIGVSSLHIPTLCIYVQALQIS